MKILKKNQIIILVIALMLVSAGYLNYSANLNEVQKTASIGDAKLVSSNGIVETNTQETALVENQNNEIKTNANETALVENNKEQTEETTKTNAKISNEYFSQTRLNRESMYSQMVESDQKILENESIASNQKAIAQTEIKNINDTKNKIMICENLIKTKGIDDVIIFVNDKSISVVVKAENLEEDKIAQIQNIIAREMNTQINDIHISNK